MIYLELIRAFLKIGLFSFGGAYGAVPLIRDMLLENGWADESMTENLIALSESTPGPIMVNCASYVGSRQAGFLGALLATAAVVLPSFVLILLFSVLFKKAMKHPAAKAFLMGLKPALTGIIFTTGFLILQTQLCKNASGHPDPKAFMIALLLLLLSGVYRQLKKKQISPVLLILCAAGAGLLLY